MLNPCLLRRCLFIALSLCMVGCRAEPAGCQYFFELDGTRLTGIISKGGFSGIFDDSSSLKYSGCYEHDGNGLGVYFYEREFGNARLTQRLLIVSSREGYLGMYAVPEPPLSVNGSRIKFSFPGDYGNQILLDSGSPPEAVLLDGEKTEFFK